MRPPICAVCNKFANNNSDSGMVRFKLTEEEKLFNKKFEDPGFVGHKKGAEWFCEVHYSLAKKYKELSAKEAIHKIKNEIKED